MLKSSEIVKRILTVESNILKGCEWLELSRQYSSWYSDGDIGNTTFSVRELLVNFEKTYGTYVIGEGSNFKQEYDAFIIDMSRYSRL